MTSSDKNGVGKNTLLVLVLIVVVLAVALGYVLINSNTNQTDNVRITEFTKLAAEDQNNGYMYWPFRVKIANIGSNDVSGWNLVLRFLGDGAELGRDTTQLTTFNSGYERIYTMGVTLGYNVPLGKTITYEVTLSQGDKILDEDRLP
jgi:hypothetical protein